jgi:hypothetical protein
MHYVLLSSTGNMFDSYEEESIARAALRRIVDAEPEAVEDVALMIYGEDGHSVGGPVFVDTQPASAE